MLIGVAPLVVLGGVLFALYYRDTRQKVRQRYVEQARSVVLTTEATREGMGVKWDKGLFSAQQLRGWADKKDIDRILEAVPVVTAWRAAMAKATEAGYEFRVPKLKPRNPKNEPDAIEAQALETLTREGLAEYHVIDPARHAVRYFRPV